MKTLFLSIILLSCNPYPTAKKELAIDPTIKTVDKRLAALEIIQKRNDSILSYKSIIHDAQIAALEKENISIKKSQAAQALLISDLLKDRDLKTTAITNLMNVDVGLKNSNAILLKDMSVKTAAITNLMNTDAGLKATDNILLKDMAIKTAAIINLSKYDSISKVKFISFSKDTVKTKQLIGFLQGNFYNLQKQVDKQVPSQQIAVLQKQVTTATSLMNKTIQKSDSVIQINNMYSVGLDSSQFIKSPSKIITIRRYHDILNRLTDIDGKP